MRLTGGFAYVIWFAGPKRGEFVLTMGGYHPDFHRDGYPVVPRLGLQWSLGGAIVVKGGAYFALTSEAVMAGVDVEVSAHFGWAWARLAFGAHGIVFFDPFHYKVVAYVHVSAGITIDTWFGDITILDLARARSSRSKGPTSTARRRSTSARARSPSRSARRTTTRPRASSSVSSCRSTSTRRRPVSPRDLVDRERGSHPAARRRGARRRAARRDRGAAVRRDGRVRR